MEKNLRELGIPSWTWKKLSMENLHFSAVRGIEEGKHLKTETKQSDKRNHFYTKPVYI